MKETRRADFNREPTPQEVEAAVRNVARESGDVAATDDEVREELERKAAEMGESFRHELSAEDFAIIEAQEQLGHAYAYKMRRDGTDTAPRDLSSLEGNQFPINSGDDGDILVFWEDSKKQ